MSDSALRHRSQPKTVSCRTHDDVPAAVDPDDVLDVLSDEHARAVLETVTGEALPAKAITERLDVSRATVYRRLDRLEAAGVVVSTTALHSEGHHRNHYRATLEDIELSFAGGGLSVEAADGQRDDNRDTGCPYPVPGDGR